LHSEPTVYYSIRHFDLYYDYYVLELGILTLMATAAKKVKREKSDSKLEALVKIL